MNWLVCTLLLIKFVHVLLLNQNYGPYKIEFLKYEKCKGPKREDCGTLHFEYNTNNTFNIRSIFNFSKDCPVNKVKIVIGTIQKGKRNKKLWNYNINEPCQHFVLGPLFIKKFNLAYNNCNITKGHYEVELNMDDLTTKFLGSNFFYDTYFFKTFGYNNVDNFFCIYTEIKILKL